MVWIPRMDLICNKQNSHRSWINLSDKSFSKISFSPNKIITETVSKTIMEIKSQSFLEELSTNSLLSWYLSLKRTMTPYPMTVWCNRLTTSTLQLHIPIRINSKSVSWINLSTQTTVWCCSLQTARAGSINGHQTGRGLQFCRNRQRTSQKLSLRKVFARKTIKQMPQLINS